MAPCQCPPCDMDNCFCNCSECNDNSCICMCHFLEDETHDLEF